MPSVEVWNPVRAYLLDFATLLTEDTVLGVSLPRSLIVLYNIRSFCS